MKTIMFSIALLATVAKANDSLFIRTDVIEQIPITCMGKQIETQVTRELPKNAALKDNPYYAIEISSFKDSDGETKMSLCVTWANKDWAEDWVGRWRSDYQQEYREGYIHYLRNEPWTNSDGRDFFVSNAVRDMTKNDCAHFQFSDDYEEMEYYSGFMGSKPLEITAWDYDTSDAYDKYGAKLKDYWADDFDLENENYSDRVRLSNNDTGHPMTSIAIGGFTIENFSIDRGGYRDCLVSEFQKAQLNRIKYLAKKEKCEDRSNCQ